MRVTSCVVAVVLAAGASEALAAGVVTTMTPESVQQALDAGKAQKPALYRLATKLYWLQFDTPFLRVARKAGEAREKSQPIEAALATPDLTAAELRITAGPEPIGESTHGIKAVTIVSASGATLQPKSSTKVTDYARTKHGKITLRGMSAVFPISALEPGASFHLQIDNGTEEVFKLEPSWFGETR
jgi:hypothetical protein